MIKNKYDFKGDPSIENDVLHWLVSFERLKHQKPEILQKIALMLLDAGVISKTDAKGINQALSLTASHGWVNVVQKMFQKGFAVDIICLREAARNGHLEMVDLLLRHRADPLRPSIRQEFTKFTLAIQACITQAVSRSPELVEFANGFAAEIVKKLPGDLYKNVSKAQRPTIYKNFFVKRCFLLKSF